MRTNHKSLKFDWLLKDAQPTSNLLNGKDIPWTLAPLPKKIGIGGYEGWFLTSGIAVYHSSYRFSEKIGGQLIPIAKVTTKFCEPTLMIQTLSKGRVIHKDQLAPNDLIYGDGTDLFRYCEEVSVTPVIDTTSDIDHISIMLSKTSLSNLIGEELTEQLLNELGLQPIPRVAVKSIPNYVNHSLQNCLRAEYSPGLKKVAAQARVLEYLSDLTKHICESADKNNSAQKNNKKRVKELRQYLIELEGKLPTINSLATQFGRSARILNEEFQHEYGDSIFNFVLNYRLNVAHKAIVNSDVSLKQMAERLGYAHVNHFSAAFKRKFGYAPGSLRRK